MDKDTLLKKGQRRTGKATIDGLGEVCLRSLSEAEWSAYQRDSVDLTTGQVTAQGLSTAKPRLIALVVAKEDGARLFSNADVPAIQEMDAAVVNKLYDACEKFCGVLGDDAKN